MAKRKKKKKNPLAGLGPLLIAVLFLMSVILIADQVKTARAGFTPEDFAWDGERMTCLRAHAAAGIDVSYYQGQIDWAQVKASGIEFVFVRVGYRSSEDGRLRADEMGQQNLTQASQAGLQVGAYFFSQALTPEEAAEEAAFAMELLKGHELDLPIAYDWEFVDDQARTRSMTKEALMECVEAFCSAVEAQGYDSLVYFNRDISRRMLDLERIDRPIWFAMYDTFPDLPRKPQYWQYTDQGKVPGIKGNVDLNLGFFL